MIKKEICRVLEQEEIAERTYRMIVAGELAGRAKAGQFVHIKIGGGTGPLLRRPISISGIDRDMGRFTMIYRVSGQGTEQLSKAGAGSLLDILGPLGNGFPLEEAGPGSTAMLVGGGIGVPPLYELSRELVKKGVRVIHVLGFQSAGAAFYEQEFSRLGDTYIATVDGSYGQKGFVTDVINSGNFEFDILYACGPTPMLKALEYGFPDKKVYLSLEQRMACGIGACFACVCRTQGDGQDSSYQKVCSDGPVFRAGEVVL